MSVEILSTFDCEHHDISHVVIKNVIYTNSLQGNMNTSFCLLFFFHMKYCMIKSIASFW